MSNNTEDDQKKTACPWYKPHKYSEWKDLNDYTNKINQPVLVQEKRCTACNHAVRRAETIR